MRERHLRKIQKQRHMSNILIMILNNPIFKNLDERDRRKMARLIYKAEMVEMHARDKDIVRVNTSFQSIIDAIRINIEQIDERELNDFIDDDFDDDDDFNQR
jgi:hypothetical protein